MELKSTFLNGELKEEVYIYQPEGFKLSNDPDIVCKLKKEMYGLKKVLRAWYGRIDSYLLNQGFEKGSTNNNLYFKIK